MAQSIPDLEAMTEPRYGPPHSEGDVSTVSWLLLLVEDFLPTTSSPFGGTLYLVLAPLSLLALIAGQGTSCLLELAFAMFSAASILSRLLLFTPTCSSFELYTSTTTMATSCVER